MSGTALNEPTTLSFELWGGLAEIAVSDPAGAGAAREAVALVVDEFDRACSSFRIDSQLAAVNRSGGRPVEVGQVLFDAIEAALRAARVTDGDVDPTVGLALVAHRLLPGGEALGPISFEPVPGYRTVTLDPQQRTVTVASGVRLDLGATAKALAADRAAAAAARAAGCGVLVSLLGDLSIAGEPPAGGWPVRVTDDHRGGFTAPGQTISVRQGGLATSSTTARRTADGRGHHVIDPRTGRPAAVSFRTVSVAAASCLDANIAATAAIVRGFAALPWLAQHGLAARLIDAAGLVTYTGGWPEEGDELG